VSLFWSGLHEVEVGFKTGSHLLAGSRHHFVSAYTVVNTKTVPVAGFRASYVLRNFLDERGDGRPAVRRIACMQENEDTSQWFYKMPTGKRGPIATSSLVEMLRACAIPADSAVWRYGMETWMPAADVAELVAAGFNPSAVVHGPRAHARWQLAFFLIALAVAVIAIAPMLVSPRRPPPKEPASLRERLIAIGRSADLESMPRVIDAIDDPDESVAVTAVTVAEGLLGIRYSKADREDLRVLVGKIEADWRNTQNQMRRRRATKKQELP
jgi:GYF domain 2